MNHGWQHLKIEDCFEYIKNGANIKQSREASGYPITRIETLSNGVFNRNKVGYANIFNLNKYETNVLCNGDLLMSHINSSKFLGRTVVYHAKNDEIFIHGMNLLRLIPNKIIISDFFYYVTLTHYFKSEISQIRKDAVNQSSFSISDLKKILIPIPPKEIQEQIVCELDKLNELIEIKRNQLKDLDALAQSLFYETFGDPIENPKGWETYKIADRFLLKAGKAIKASELFETEDFDLYPCYGGNGIRGYIAKKSHIGQYCIIGRQGALCGNISLTNGAFYATEHAIVVSPKSYVSVQWLYYLLTELNLNKYAKGVAQPGLSVSVINEVNVPVPPLSLQNEFAAKIEAIEEQKRLIESSIADLETLLASRMDYWFND